MNVQAFAKSENNSLSVTSTTASITWTTGVGTNEILIKNVGATEAFWRSGLGPQTALTTDESIPAGAIMVYTIPVTDTVFAAITASGTTTLRVSRGEGQ
jgi:hypothetical protein